ncbi:MAG: zinc dependent phospholipase C family protein [Bacteroidia bacterium]|jgi:hypothetical protein|nr:zinc dependent phospholipase C family protein [Bacteroidia bacterium]
MKKTVVVILLLIGCVNLAFTWGFFAHQLINRLAVFTLPTSLLSFYKGNIEYITVHAVDPDKRRYTDTSEAVRHYIDLDYYEQSYPVDTVPKWWKDAVAKYSEDTLLEYGIVPWHIYQLSFKLTEAFKAKDKDRILHYSADIGHYIGDAHVPLHATLNYNGQLTNQHGIHGFWESRLPELFSSDYSFFVGRAVYIDDILGAAWRASATSFAAKDSVLQFEATLSKQYPSDAQYTLVTKGQKQVKTYSEGYAKAYHQALNGQVERRMRESIWLIGSIWYTCWVNAGQPDLGTIASPSVNDETLKKEIEQEALLLQQKQMIGREE